MALVDSYVGHPKVELGGGGLADDSGEGVNGFDSRRR